MPGRAQHLCIKMLKGAEVCQLPEQPLQLPNVQAAQRLQQCQAAPALPSQQIC